MNQQGMENCALEVCEAVTDQPLFPNEFSKLNDGDLTKLITVGQYVTDLCINELERRGLIEVNPKHGPMLPYDSDHAVETILTRETA